MLISENRIIKLHPEKSFWANLGEETTSMLREKCPNFHDFSH